MGICILIALDARKVPFNSGCCTFMIIATTPKNIRKQTTGMPIEYSRCDLLRLVFFFKRFDIDVVLVAGAAKTGSPFQVRARSEVPALRERERERQREWPERQPGWSGLADWQARLWWELPIPDCSRLPYVQAEQCWAPAVFFGIWGSCPSFQNRRRAPELLQRSKDS